MFRRLPEAGAAAAEAPVTVTIDDEEVVIRAGDTVAAALILAGYKSCRDTVISGAPRGPFCMMGICYDCLVMIDGRPNQQACMTRVLQHMRIERQSGVRDFT